MTAREHPLHLPRKASLLWISHGSFYLEARLISDADLKPVRWVNELHMEYLDAGIRIMKGLHRHKDFTAQRLFVATSVQNKGIRTLSRKPNTSEAVPC